MNEELKGKRVRLIKMDDKYTKLKEGDEGTIKYQDDLDNIHVRWDNGEGLSLIPDVDEYEILDEKNEESNKTQVKRFKDI